MNKGSLVRDKQRRDEVVRAVRHQHRCHGCRKVIAAGEVRRIGVTVTGADVYWHDKCGK